MPFDVRRGKPYRAASGTGPGWWTHACVPLTYIITHKRIFCQYNLYSAQNNLNKGKYINVVLEKTDRSRITA